MANPQKGNGYTAIANEIMEALVGIRISGEARQALDFILRKTYGFNKRWDKISLSQFSFATRMKRPTVARNIKKLEKMNLIVIKKDNTCKVNSYRFNKDYDAWKPLSKKITVIRSVIKKDTYKSRYYKRKYTG